MKPNTFWISSDGVIVAAREMSEQQLQVTIAFKLLSAADVEFARAHCEQLQFSERSTLARVGIEVICPKPPKLEGSQLLLRGEAFVYDPTFPTASCFKNLLRRGTSAGRLYYAPEQNKLSATEVWQALRENHLKLPNSISIDRFGRVFLTAHRVKYTLPTSLEESDLERVLRGDAPRTFLDKVQVREDTEVVSIPPHSGVLTSCSMYLQSHYVVLNRGEGNFGLHSGAVLLDPVKTFGTNVMLEIYNTSDEVVVNPMVSIEVYRAGPDDDEGRKAIEARRIEMHEGLDRAYALLESNPRIRSARARPTTGISLRGQSAKVENPCVCIGFDGPIKENLARSLKNEPWGYVTIAQALSHATRDSDTLVIDYFPNLFEHIEILARLERVNIRRLVFRRASRLNPFFLNADAHARLETYHQLGISVYWMNESLNDLYMHSYKKGHGFFIREEEVERFQACTILAFYGSAVSMEEGHARAIRDLVLRMTDFFGPNVGVLTGGGGGVMGLANAAAHEKNCLTGASFLELEAQPPNTGVDFFNCFTENSRHNRQKWFQVADFCIFSIGGVGTLEETGIELCNLKLGIRPRVPYVFFHNSFWNGLRDQFQLMIKTKRAPAWMADYVLFSGNVDEIIGFFRRTLHIA
ncbi:MAG TPA: LOG family protein [Opitutaceae bacterium]